MRYRYILCGVVNMDDPVSNYRLIGASAIHGECDMIRIEIPDDMELEKWSCDNYSTTSDKRLVKDFNPIMLVKINKRWYKKPELNNCQPHLVHEVMEDLGFRPVFHYGYLNKKWYHKWWEREIPHYDQYGKEYRYDSNGMRIED